jgi:hypothetical protein
MEEIDREALKRALVACRTESPARAKQIDSMLLDEPWERVAVFAASCAQSRSLGLMPWQSPPFRANLAHLKKPFDDPRGERESAELLKRLLDANLSPFEPDPIAALERAEKKRAV